MTDRHVDYFGCKHPIVCAAMHQVSDAGLAIAVNRAGAFPSLSMPNYIRNGGLDLRAYLRDLRDFQVATGSDKLLLSVGSRLLMSDAVIEPFLGMGFRHIELFHWASTEPGWDVIMDRSRRLADRRGVKFVFKISTGHLAHPFDYPTILLKGPEGAGRSAEDSPPLSQSFDTFRNRFPSTNVIVSGGIYAAAQVSDYVQRGALAVAIGSLFAAARESPVSDAVKAKIIASGASDLKRLGDRNLQGVFSGVVEGDNANLTRTLALGVKDPGKGGIFMGSAVDHITEVLTVQEIVNRLMGLAVE